MVKAVVVRLCWLLAGMIVGAVVVFLIMWFAVDRSCSSDYVETVEDYTNTTGTRANDTLRLVVVVTRHGNRGGYSDYALDPYPLNNTEYWPYGASALTPVGRVQAYNLGAKLRSLYNGFLPTTFKSADVFCDSDVVERVIMSGELVLAGVYPPRGWQLWNPSVHWQPIALYTNSSDRSQDIWTCEVSAAEMEDSLNAFVTDAAANVTEMTSIYYNATGSNATASTLSSFFDKIISEDIEGYVLPNWTNSLYPEPLTSFYGDYFLAEYAGTDTIVRLIVGELYTEILETMQSKSNGSLQPDGKIYVHSGHDTTVLPMQVALGVDRDSVIKPVKPGSAVIIELHEDSDAGEYYVQVLYIDGYSSDLEPTSLSLPDCGDPCYLQALINSTSRFTNVSYEEECEATSSLSTSTSTSSSTTDLT